MCNFDGVFKLIKEMSIAQNLYFTVPALLFTTLLLITGLITLNTVLSNNFFYKDIMNVVDNMDYWEINMYMISADLSYISSLENYQTLLNLYSNIQNNLEKMPEFLIDENTIDYYFSDILITREEFINNKSKTKNYSEDVKQFLIMLSFDPNIIRTPIIYKNYDTNNFNNAEFVKYKKILKNSYLLLNLIKESKPLGLDMIYSDSENIKNIDKVFLDNRISKTYFYFPGDDKEIKYDNIINTKIISDKYSEKAKLVEKTRNFIPQNKKSILEIITKTPLILDRPNQELNFFENYKPEIIALSNKYPLTYIEENVSNQNYTKNDSISEAKKISESFEKSSINTFFLSGLNILKIISNEIYFTSNYHIFPIYTLINQNLDVINPVYCQLLLKYFEITKHNNKTAFILSDCMGNNEIWEDFMSSSLNIKLLNETTNFEFCDFNKEKNKDIFCLNRFSLKKNIMDPNGKKSFKYKNTIIPFLSYESSYTNKSISNYYMSTYFKKEGSSLNFQETQYAKIIEVLFFVFLICCLILYLSIIYFVFKILSVKKTIERPFNLIKESLNNISDKLKFKENKKALDDYLQEPEYETISEFKFLIKIILKLIEGNLSMGKKETKFTDLETIQIYNEIQPINMVKFNRYLIFENKIMESLDKNEYLIDLIENATNDIKNDEYIGNSFIFQKIIFEKYFDMNCDKEENKTCVVSKCSEENFRNKYQFLTFENFKTKNLKNPNTNENYEGEDIYKIDLIKLDGYLDDFVLEIKDNYIQEHYKENENQLFSIYNEVFSK